MFPIHAAQPAQFTAALPTIADVVVIGGGVVGVMTVWELARAGINAVLLEKGRIAGEQSSRNWGWVRAQGRDFAELPIMLEAQTMWPKLEAEAGSVGLQQTGTLYLADSAADLDKYQGWLDQAAAFQVSSHILTSGQVAQMMPDAARRWAGALYTPTDMRAEPWQAVPAFARAAVRAGATIIEDCAVRTLDRGAGRVTGVMTEQGLIKTDSVVLSGGAWSSLFLRRHGISLPQLSVRATVARTDALPNLYDGGAVDSRLAWRRRADGGYTLAQGDFHELFIGPDAFRALRPFAPQLIQDFGGTRFLPAAPKGYPDAWSTPRQWDADRISPFERMRVLNPTPNARKVAKLARDFSATFPGVGPTPIKMAWAGMIDVLPDVVPVVDRCDALPGLTIATGLSGHGFGIGPAIGRIAARLASGRDSGHDLSRFRLSRFSDGSRLVPGPSL
ncbi:NAD(P)/FAD-dependent oxidoreductase [Yoonia sediminilitoris]|uniref:Glycine/D-amino acid oxidase-like deaminating enzyme n=1 Tax=Yoonia sediminilitoris TaxID=1286148 RepID=A0A2T6KR61_9RHOB|nr:FAD-binding oxidoreductase [Yoonia sediminilitoris]PUB19039.1 glycine/D-amino acid oxidase-like deaminating enzyme [Yoonia sediminilitoris]RCW99207.1 glycine/D-amino acid oxidase-like deaminating enzyme [Yoonia sediminilitoris]